MQRFIAALGIMLAYTPAVVAEELSPAALRQAIHATLRAESTTSGAERETAVRRLTELYRAAETHEGLSDASRRQLTALLRARLKRVEATLAGTLSQTTDTPMQLVDASTAPPRPRAILAQIPGNQPGAAAPGGGAIQNNPSAAAGNLQPPAAGAFAAQTAANANQLIELIQNTIAPKSWDVRGGPGTIRYFAPAQVLVIRQTGGIHDQVGAAIGNMRANRGQP